MKAREPGTEWESLCMFPQLQHPDVINKQTCCVRIDVLFPLLLSYHSFHLFIYLLLFPGSLVCFQCTSVLLAPCRIFKCCKTLVGLGSSYPAALNALSFQSSTGLYKSTNIRNCLSTCPSVTLTACPLKGRRMLERLI